MEGNLSSNRGRKCKIFLGGPIQYLRLHGNSAAVIASHRDVSDALTAAGFEVLSAHEVEQYGEISDSFSPEEVTKRDFGWAQECDIYVAILPLDPHGVPYRTDGTHIEIGWVTAMDKKTVLMVGGNATKPYSHLVQGMIDSGWADVIPIEEWRHRLVPLLAELAGR